MFSVCCASVFSVVAEAAESAKVTVTVNTVTAQGVGKSIGTITFEDSKDGLKIIPQLTELSPGHHGFHIHENPSCEPKDKDGVMTAAQAAGPHFDPTHAGKHSGPHGGGHAGDLPVLNVGEDGKTTGDLAPVKGLTVAAIMNRSVMVHAGGDNYSDTPAPLGGGGARVACGVVR